MLLIALRNLLQERTRLLLSVIGVVAAVGLILLSVGIYGGVIRQFTLFVDKSPTDLIIVKKGISDLFHGVSLVPQSAVEQLRTEPGIKDVVPMIAQRGVYEQPVTNSAGTDQPGNKYDLYINSVVQGKPQGAPWEVKPGRLVASDNEVNIPEAMANKIGKKVGDTLKIDEEEFKIAGLVPDASIIGLNYTWVTYAKAEAKAKLPGMVNFVWVTLDNPAKASQVVAELSTKYPDLHALTKEAFLDNNRAELAEGYLPIIRAMVVIAFIVGTAIIGLTIYTATIDKAREYGVLKAIGVTNAQLYGVVLVQALGVTLVGLGLGIVITLGLKGWLGTQINLTPMFDTVMVAKIAGLGIVMGLLASFVPVRRIVRIDPAEVFRS